MGFVDDLLLLATGKKGHKELQEQWTKVVDYLTHYGMHPGIDTAGTKTRYTSTDNDQKPLIPNGHPEHMAPWIDQTVPYRYLGIQTTLTQNPVQAQINKTTQILAADLNGLQKLKLTPVQYIRILNMKIIAKLRYVMRAFPLPYNTIANWAHMIQRAANERSHITKWYKSPAYYLKREHFGGEL